MSRATLRLQIDVTFELNGADVDDLRDNMMDLATRGKFVDMLTEDTDALVVLAHPSVEALE